MRCPICHHDDTYVIDSRPNRGDDQVRRRRTCRQCNAKFTTFERVHLRNLSVLKSNGEKELFELDKLTRSILIACRKRPIKIEQIEALAVRIQNELEQSGETEFASKTLGTLVMRRLEKMDDVAMVRFASVYHDFKSVGDFMRFFARRASTPARKKKGGS